MQFIQSKPKEGFSLDFRGSKDFGKDDILGHWLDILTKEKWQDEGSVGPYALSDCMKMRNTP